MKSGALDTVIPLRMSLSHRARDVTNVSRPRYLVYLLAPIYEICRKYKERQNLQDRGNLDMQLMSRFKECRKLKGSRKVCSKEITNGARAGHQ